MSDNQAYVGGGQIVNLETAEGGQFVRGAAERKQSTQRVGGQRLSHQRKKKSVQNMLPHHKKNVSYESYLLNRPIFRRYSNALDGVSVDDAAQNAAATAGQGGTATTFPVTTALSDKPQEPDGCLSAGAMNATTNAGMSSQINPTPPNETPLNEHINNS